MKGELKSGETQMKSEINEKLHNNAKSDFFFLRNSKEKNTIYTLIKCMLIFCVFVLCLISNSAICEVTSEGEFKLDTEITVNMKIGTSEKPDIVSTKAITFFRVDNRIRALLKIGYFSAPQFTWQTNIELLNESGKVLGQAKVKGSNGVLALEPPTLNEHEQRYSFGVVENISEVRRFRITISQVEEKINDKRIKAAIESRKNTYYGKILFEDGKPAVVNLPLSGNATASVSIKPDPPNNQYHLYSGISQENGLFSLYIIEEVLKLLKSGECNIVISCPWYDSEGGRLSKQIGIFPADLLTNDRSAAKEFRVKRPEDINNCPITYESRWTSHGDYMNGLMSQHKEKYIADAEKMAEKVEWGLPENGLRCKLVCSNRDIKTNDPLFLMIYFQNVSQNELKLNSDIGRIIDLSLNDNIVGKGPFLSFGERKDDLWGDEPEYITIKPGEIVKEPLPVGALRYTRLGDDVESHALSTSKPGIYNIKAIYPVGRPSNREQPKTISNTLVIRTGLINKDVYEGQLILDKDLSLILYNGTEFNPYIVKANSIIFEKTDKNVVATLKVSFLTNQLSPDYNWQTELEILDDEGKILTKYQRTDDNSGKAKVIDRDLFLPLGSWSVIETAKKFRVSFISVTGK